MQKSEMPLSQKAKYVLCKKWGAVSALEKPRPACFSRFLRRRGVRAGRIQARAWAIASSSASAI